MSFQILFIFIVITSLSIVLLYNNYQRAFLADLDLIPNVEAQTSFTKTEIKPDENGILTVNYHGVQGKVYNPLTVASGALKYYNDYVLGKDKQDSKEKFISSADWLVKNVSNKELYSIWEYHYPWMFYGWISPPYSSSLAQSKGLLVLTLAYELTGSEKYLSLAHKIFKSFLIDYDDGGFVSKEDTSNNSLFLHIVAKPGFQKSYVLNGHTQSLLNLWTYYEKTREPLAKAIFDKGINYLKKNLEKYDSGYWSYYDLMEYWAMIGYQKGQIQQLKDLYKISKEPVLIIYADRFQKYLNYLPIEATK